MTTEDVAGTWDLRMRTPIGLVEAQVAIERTADGFRGTATGKAETVPLRDLRVEPVADGARVTWSQSITRPMRLHLDFDVVVRGDDVEGHSRAGRLPRSAVSGSRVR